MDGRWMAKRRFELGRRSVSGPNSNAVGHSACTMSENGFGQPLSNLAHFRSAQSSSKVARSIPCASAFRGPFEQARLDQQWVAPTRRFNAIHLGRKWGDHSRANKPQLVVIGGRFQLRISFFPTFVCLVSSLVFGRRVGHTFTNWPKQTQLSWL